MRGANKTKHIYCYFSEACFCFRTSHEILCFPQRYIHPPSIFLNPLGSDLSCFSTLSPTMFEEWFPDLFHSNNFVLSVKSYLYYSISKISSFQFQPLVTKNLSYINCSLSSILTNFILLMILRTLTSPYSPSVQIYFWLQVLITSKSRSSVMLF